MKIYRAYYDSRNFSFQAFSRSKESAKFHLLQGLHEHTKQYNLEPDWYLYDGREDIYFQEITLDTPYRDGDIL